MFELQDVGLAGRRRSSQLQDMQYEICLSYIRHASEKLALKQSALMLQSTLFLNSLASQHDKSLTEPSSTEASFENRRPPTEEILSPRAAERRAFMRKSKRGCDRPTLRSREQALQQVREVCSEGTIAVIEVLMNEYQKIVEDATRSDFKEAFCRKKCENCLARPPQPHPAAELEERLKKVSGELRTSVGRNEQLGRQLSQKAIELERSRVQLMSQEAVRTFLSAREETTVARLQEVKLVEREILLRLEGICQAGACQRCNSVRAVKSQLVDFRTYLERQAENLQRLYQRFKRTLQGIR